jgi:hypothetical protein
MREEDIPMTVRNNKQSDEEGQEHLPLAELLSENHRRVLANTLRRVEVAAWRLEEQLTRETPPQRIHLPQSSAQSYCT